MQRGFTLVELLVIIAIIAILLAILTPSVTRALEITEMLRCASRMRQVGLATIGYAGNHGERLPGPNWLLASSRGWLYSNTQMSDLAHVEAGLLWPYLQSHDAYRCPADEAGDPTQLPHYPNNSRAITSYCMNGSVCGYGGREKVSAGGYVYWDTYKTTDFDPTDIIMWEADETTDAKGWWHDGANYPWEGITRRHTDRGNASCADGHAEWILLKDYYEMGSSSSPGPNRLWNRPGSLTGR